MGDTLYTFEVVKPILAEDEDGREVEVHLDKWLWAARCYKTRTLARQAVESGKVLCNGERARPTRSLNLGDVITLQFGNQARTLIVRSLSKQRRSAPEACELYEETPESIANRESQDLEYAGSSPYQHHQQGRSAHRQAGFQSPYQNQGSFNQQQNRAATRARFLRRGPKQEKGDEQFGDKSDNWDED